jgi:anti-sigma regulatory factor (Ser/Thr protein kinase)
MVKQTASKWFPRSLAAPASARAFLACTLATWGRPEAGDDAQLLVDELVTNVVRHTATGDVGVSLELVGACLRLAVTDHEPQNLLARDVPHGEGGYGLNILDALANAWGCEANGSTKTVWADLLL